MSDAPTFLTLAEVINLHRRGIAQFGGSPEIRDLGLLQSALAMPESAFGGEYLHAGLAAMGAPISFTSSPTTRSSMATSESAQLRRESSFS